MRTKMLLGLMVLSGFIASVFAATQAPSNIVGASRCRECHPSAYQAWERSLHKNASQSLPKERAEDPGCIQCHGSMDSAVGSVQCESCHGPGRYYARGNVMKDRDLARLVGLTDVKPESCKRCHSETAPTIRPYDYGRMWKSVEHGLEAKKPAKDP